MGFASIGIFHVCVYASDRYKYSTVLSIRLASRPQSICYEYLDTYIEVKEVLSRFKVEEI